MYVQVPFCSTTCAYCAFYQVRSEDDDLARYLMEVDTEFSLVETPLRAGTVFWGGGTRISLGVQSLQPDLLAALCRRHTRDQALRAYDLVRAAGFASVNVDLMFALPGQEAADWGGDLAAAIALGADHISTYCLTFEEDTALYVKLSQGNVTRDAEQ